MEMLYLIGLLLHQDEVLFHSQVCLLVGKQVGHFYLFLHLLVFLLVVILPFRLLDLRKCLDLCFSTFLFFVFVLFVFYHCFFILFFFWTRSWSWYHFYYCVSVFFSYIFGLVYWIPKCTQLLYKILTQQRLANCVEYGTNIYVWFKLTLVLFIWYV